MVYEDEISPYLEDLELQLQHERNKNLQMSNQQSSLFGQPNDENLIKWQLDLRDELDRIYHLLKGDVIHEDKDGNVFYKEPIDDELKPFNEFGVQLVMNIISFYINKNTLLSNYDEETIKWKVLDFGNEISDLILCRYKDMMMTTSFEKEFKKEYGCDCEILSDGDYIVKIDDYHYYLSNKVKIKIKTMIAEHLERKVELYPMIVQELVDSIHSAYLRALAGGERESLRTARVVSQNENIGMQSRMNVPNPGSINKKFSFFNPKTWL